MISVVGLGNAASEIAGLFSEIKQYKVFKLNSKVDKNSKYNFKLKRFDKPEEYEYNIPNLNKFFQSITNNVQFFVVGGSFSSNYTLGVLEQLKDKKVDLIYVQPDTELLTGYPVLIENTTFGVLQEYARSGLVNSIILISNLAIEESLGDINIKNYYDSLNNFIFSAVHHLNYFTHSEPEIGQVSRPAEINRIRSIAGLNMKNLEEKWFFGLDTPRELCYYLAINTERLETEGGLHKKIVDMLKQKPKNAFRKISYAIYETPYHDFGFCVAHTNVVQTKKTLDKLEQE